MLGLHKKARGCAAAPRFAHGAGKSGVFEVGMGEEIFIFGWEGLRAAEARLATHAIAKDETIGRPVDCMRGAGRSRMSERVNVAAVKIESAPIPFPAPSFGL